MIYIYKLLQNKALLTTFLFFVSAIGHSAVTLQTSSLRYWANRIGVDVGTVVLFQKQIRQDYRSGNATKIKGIAASPCTETQLMDNNESRTQLVRCLNREGIEQLNSKFFSDIFSEKNKRIRLNEPGNIEIQKTIGLLTWLEDLAREAVFYSGRKSNWYEPGRGFLAIDKVGDFAYQDGDIVLVMGDTGISAVISQATMPQRRFSHALMVRVEDGKKTTLEALAPGVIENDWKHFEKIYNRHVVVLRWKDAILGAQIAERASKIGLSLVKDKVKYDFDFDILDSSTLFCSEFVAYAYSQATKDLLSPDKVRPIEKLIPTLSEIKNERVFDMLKILGLKKPQMISPGDLLNVPELEIVADFRNHEKMTLIWTQLSAGDAFIELVEKGVKLSPSWFREALSYVAKWIGKVPDSLEKKYASGYVALETAITQPAMKGSKKLSQRYYGTEYPSILELPVWEIRAFIMDGYMRGFFPRHNLVYPQ